MSMYSDGYEPSPEWEEYTPHPDDTYWMDKKGKLHHIPHMDTAYCEACIRFLHNKGFKHDVIPIAFFKRYNKRHEIIKEEFEVYDD